MIEIKLPCEIGVRIKDNKGYEGCIIGYQIIGSGNPLSPSHKVLAETEECLITVYDGMFPDGIEIIGY